VFWVQPRLAGAALDRGRQRSHGKGFSFTGGNYVGTDTQDGSSAVGASSAVGESRVDADGIEAKYDLCNAGIFVLPDGGTRTAPRGRSEQELRLQLITLCESQDNSHDE
jgi:hypothetical protein